MRAVLSRLPEVAEGRIRFAIELAPHEAWDVRVDILVSLDGGIEQPALVAHRFGTERAGVRRAPG